MSLHRTHAIYRVSFVGSDLPDAARDEIWAAGDAWEGSEVAPERPECHRVLVQARTEDEAVAKLLDVIGPYGEYSCFSASVVLDARGREWAQPFYRSWDEIDWHARRERVSLTCLERTVLRGLSDDAEPAWIIALDPTLSQDRAALEVTLKRLEERGIVTSVPGESGEPGRESELDSWWSLTPEGWDLLGLVRSPRYPSSAPSLGT